MTNREFIASLTKEQFAHFNIMIRYKCELCAYWNTPLCIRGDFERCDDGMEKWLNEEHEWVE